jgi:hypothetical protein
VPLRIITGREALAFAQRHQTPVVQEVTGNDLRDNIERFYSCPFDGTREPAEYFAVKRDDVRGYTCLWRHHFHRLDWGGVVDHPIDKHEGDFEGACYCYPDDDLCAYIITRRHTNLIVTEAGDPEDHWPFYETKGHGCFASDDDIPFDSYRVYSAIPLVPLYDDTGDYTSEAKIMQKQFDQWGHVDWPDELADRQTTLRRRWNVGDYWNDPLGLIEKMRRQYP